MDKLFGFHYIVQGQKSFESYVEAVAKYMAPQGMNTALIEINNTFQFKSHPEISDGDITAQSLRAGCDILRAAGVEPIPLYNCFSHQGWKSRNSLLKAYPEFEEAPHIPDENLIAKEHIHDGQKQVTTYTPAWCGNEPRVFDVVIPAIQELIDATDAKTIHLGMDEVFLFGQCDRCRGMAPAALFRNTVMRLYDHFSKKGLKVMLWGDRLLNATKLLGQEKGAGRMYDYETLGVSDCIDELAKDIIICDWHYSPEESYPSAGELFDHGYSVWPSCWYNTEAAIALWEDTLKQAKARGALDRLPGLLVTGWSIGTYPADCFTKDASELDERQNDICETIRVMAGYMKDYFK